VEKHFEFDDGEVTCGGTSSAAFAFKKSIFSSITTTLPATASKFSVFIFLPCPTPRLTGGAFRRKRPRGESINFMKV